MSLVQSLNDYCLTVNTLITEVDVLIIKADMSNVKLKWDGTVRNVDCNWNEMVQRETLTANNRTIEWNCAINPTKHLGNIFSIVYEQDV
jgi:hypothetical protein